jgi:hypothetical protein
LAAERLVPLIGIGARKARNVSNARVRDGIRFAPLDHGQQLKQGEGKMIHMILVLQKAGEMAKAVFVIGESLFPPLSLEPDFVETFRIFSKLEVVTNEDREKFISMLKETGHAYGNPIVKPDSGAYLGFAGHAY